MTVLIQILTLHMSHTTNLDNLEAIEVLKMTSGLNISKKIKKSKTERDSNPRQAQDLHNRSDALPITP